MESVSSRQQAQEREQAELRRQIALLQSKLVDSGTTDPAPPPVPASPKRKRSNSLVLAPATPSKKRRTSPRPSVPSGQSARYSHGTSAPPRTSSKRPPLVSSAGKTSSVAPPKPAPSNVLSKLSKINARPETVVQIQPPERSSSFTAKASTARPEPVPDEASTAPKRDDRLALVEDLEPGPYDHKAPFDDPLFEKLEPHSGIYLSSRTIPHEDINEYMMGRFYLSPSTLYGAVRLLPNNAGYDVPVVGDWVTIAVVAERGPIRVTQGLVSVGPGEERDADADKPDASGAPADKKKPYDKDKPAWKGKGKGKEDPRKRSGRKYVNLKLVDFGARTRGSSSGGKAVIRGDAFVSLLLFEAEGYDTVTRDEGGRPEKVYKGGSRGAFEAMAKLREGAVVALLNPRILKPFQAKAGGTPHPTTNILALTPESAASVAVIGHARDLGMCSAVQRDGKKCGGWCDKRVADVCDYHIQRAVERARSGRAEFSVGTSGMSSAAPKRKSAYDPARQWGLKPEAETSMGDAGGATYVVSGHVVSGNAGSLLYVGENVGREAQARAQRKGKGDDDRALKMLLERDKEGMVAVEKARQYAEKMKAKEREEAAGTGKGKGKAKQKDKGGDHVKGKEKEKKSQTEAGEKGKSGSEGEERSLQDGTALHKNAYSAQVIKKLGFDPTMKPGQRRQDPEIQKKLQQLVCQRATKDIELGPRPGKRQSVVSAPKNQPTRPSNRSVTDLPDLSDDDDLENREREAFGRALNIPARPSAGLVNLDSSDDELIIEPEETE